MFEFFPILKGLYLTYAEYFALVVGSVFLILFLITNMLGRFCYKKSKLKKKIKVESLSIPKVVKINTFRDVTRALGLIFTGISALCMCMAITSLSAFRIIPIWVALILNKVCLSILVAHTLVKYDNMKMKKFSLRRGLKRIKNWKERKLITYIFIVIFFISFALPYYFNGTCVCLYEQGHDAAINLEGVGLPLSFNTELIRMFTIQKACNDPAQPCHVYATLAEDSATEAFITIHTHTKHRKPLSLTYSSGIATAKVNSQVNTFNDLEANGQRNVHSFYLKNMLPNTEYTISIKLDDVEHTYKYKTLREQYSDEHPMVVISGGDVGNSVSAKQIWNQIGKQNFDVLLIGGDLAYDNNIVDCYWTWDLFLDEFDTLAHQLGRLPAIVLALGNHDAGLNPVSHRNIKPKLHSANPMFFSFFPQHRGQYGVPPIPDRLSFFSHRIGQSILFTLDSGYLATYQEQAKFMDEKIQYFKNKYNSTHKFAQYHHPIYSSCTLKEYESINFELGTLYWVSKFDQHQFQTIYENHVHTQKRSKQLKGNLEHANGTLYLGDGSWGANVNECEMNHNTYLEKVMYNNSVWITTLTPHTLTHKALTMDGSFCDEYTQAI